MCAATTGPRATRTPARARRCPWVTPAPLPARAGRCVHHVPQHRCQHAHLQQWQHSCSGLRTVVCAASSSSGNGSAAAAGGDAAGSSSSSSSSRSHQSGLPGLLQKWRRDTQQMQQELQALGAAGVIAYGLFNTLYYTVAFLLVWFRFSDVPTGMGWAPVTQKAAEVFALVWAGSQVTKLLRAGAALACAPLIDRGLQRLGVRDKRKAYALIVLGCVCLAAGVFCLVMLMSA